MARTLADVWGYHEISAVAAPDMLAALAYSGSYVAAIRVDGRIVGGGYGWPTLVDGEWRLHSHVVGFVEGFRSLGLGSEMKHHQMAWVRARGFAAIEWTYDPLRNVNARFNLAKLGARVVGFHPDFYGPMDDAFSQGLPSDRFLVRWGVDEGPPVLDEASMPPLLSGDADGLPVVAPIVSGLMSAEIPPDIVALGRANPDADRAWRAAFRQSVGVAMASGAIVIGFDHLHRYVIRSEGVAGPRRPLQARQPMHLDPLAR